ncbi:MAG TPA: ISAs1 family transposase [Planctomycetaceae bacterium]|nr:ISAs1 family transposase [Planctomycetaceae bacterium]
MTRVPVRHSRLQIMPDILFENVDSILDGFRDLEDPRSHVSRRHLLGDLIVISIIAVIAGADGPTAIGACAANHEAWLRNHLDLPNGILSQDTFDRLLAALKPAAFQACFETLIASVLPSDDQPDLNQVAIDGKAVRRSHDRRKGLGPLFLVSAWAVEREITLGQLVTEEKSNEITAIPGSVPKIVES